MKRTQIQIPEPLYRELQRVAKAHDWSLTEVIRRGAEYIVRCYPANHDEAWQPPRPRSLGEFLAPAEEWRELANRRED